MVTAKVEIRELHVPPYVLRGQDVRLACQYRTVGTRVYAVKWFKNKNEFFRFVPQYDPPKKTFPVAGFSVDVSDHAYLLRCVGSQHRMQGPVFTVRGVIWNAFLLKARYKAS